MGILLNRQIFIEKASIKHNGKYNYSLVKYIDGKTKVKVICPIHGEFIVSPTMHIYATGCPKCGRDKTIASNKKITTNIFIKKSQKTHGNLYDYSLVNYINPKTKVKITCKKHGDFSQFPYSHLNGSGCPECGAKKVWDKLRTKKEDFIKKSKEIHNNFYDYSKVKYTNSRNGIEIICKIHGKFIQSPCSHLIGKGCPECSINKRRDNLDSFLKKALKEHGNKYDYSKTIYKHSKKNILITCPIHGEFKQTPSSHIRGYGCPSCHESIGERTVRKYLEKNKINFTPQKKFKDCKNIKQLSFDFFLPNYNLCIEYDGEQHFKPIKYFGGIKKFNLLKKRDKIKNKYCNIKDINLLRISYKENINNSLKLFFEEFLPYL